MNTNNLVKAHRWQMFEDSFVELVYYFPLQYGCCFFTKIAFSLKTKKENRIYYTQYIRFSFLSHSLLY